jgi:hypothetical protein
MALDPYCPATYKLHDSDITFCTKCGGQNDKEVTSKAVYSQLIQLTLPVQPHQLVRSQVGNLVLLLLDPEVQ